jgi:hypothetical protein
MGKCHDLGALIEREALLSQLLKSQYQVPSFVCLV